MNFFHTDILNSDF